MTINFVGEKVVLPPMVRGEGLKLSFVPSPQDLPQDMALAIQECLSLMAAAYRGVKGQSAIIVEALILEHIYSVRKT